MRWRLSHPLIPRNDLHVATALARATLVSGIAQEILQRLEHERTKAPAILVGALEESTFKHDDKKILCEILGVGNGVPLTADESENRSPVNFAKFREGSARLLLVASRTCTGQDDAPPGRFKAVGPAFAGSKRIGVHSRSSSQLRNCWQAGNCRSILLDTRRWIAVCRVPCEAGVQRTLTLRDC